MAQGTGVTAREEIVWLDVPNGRLFAIVHRPVPERSRRACVIMLNSGQISRVGPQRLYVKAARQWADLGFDVLRLDMAGVGDSQAQNAVIHFDNHSPQEASAAVRYAREQLQADHVVLQGLCAGARAALKCAAADAEVDGVLAWSCPVFSAADGMPASPEESQGRMSASRARDNVSRLGGAFTGLRFLTLAWWRNRLRYGWAELGELARAIGHMLSRRPPPTGQFLEATDQYLRAGRRALFVYGARDRISLAEFRERFVAVPEAPQAGQAYSVVPGGTHTFTSLDAQMEVISRSAAWLDTLFPRSAPGEQPLPQGSQQAATT